MSPEEYLRIIYGSRDSVLRVLSACLEDRNFNLRDPCRCGEESIFFVIGRFISHYQRVEDTEYLNHYVTQITEGTTSVRLSFYCEGCLKGLKLGAGMHSIPKEILKFVNQDEIHATLSVRQLGGVPRPMSNVWDDKIRLSEIMKHRDIIVSLFAIRE